MNLHENVRRPCFFLFSGASISAQCNYNLKGDMITVSKLEIHNYTNFDVT